MSSDINLEKQSGGRSVFSSETIEYIAEDTKLVMNVDILYDETECTQAIVMKSGVEVDVLSEMNLVGKSIPMSCTDFTHEYPFKRLTFSKDVMLKIWIPTNEKAN